MYGKKWRYICSGGGSHAQLVITKIPLKTQPILCTSDSLPSSSSHYTKIRARLRERQLFKFNVRPFALRIIAAAMSVPLHIDKTTLSLILCLYFAIHTYFRLYIHSGRNFWQLSCFSFHFVTGKIGFSVNLKVGRFLALRLQEDKNLISCVHTDFGWNRDFFFCCEYAWTRGKEEFAVQFQFLIKFTHVVVANFLYKYVNGSFCESRLIIFSPLHKTLFLI